jgi:hypothetical protein
VEYILKVNGKPHTIAATENQFLTCSVRQCQPDQEQTICLKTET